MTRPRSSRGATLVELLVVLCILGVIAGVTVLAIRRVDRPPSSDPSAMVIESLRVAVDTPRTIVIRVMRNGRPLSATLHPDGSVVGDSAFDVNRFTGRKPHAK